MKERDNKLWLEFHKDIRNILFWGIGLFLMIVIFSGFQIIPMFNFILNGGVIVYLDCIKY